MVMVKYLYPLKSQKYTSQLHVSFITNIKKKFRKYIIQHAIVKLIFSSE